MKNRAASVLLPLLGVLLAAGLAAAAAAPARPPNIVLILADDMGWGDPRCYNRESKTPTPFIDGLAAAGMRFTDAHSPSSVCTPTRYGLLTGRYCWRTSLKRGVLQGYDPLLLEPGRPTIASLLKERGYRTGCFGKWHLGLGDAPRTDYERPLRPGPLTAGFDRFFGIPASLDMPPYLYVEGDRPVQPATGSIEASEMRRRGGGGFWRAGPIAPGFRHEDVLPRTAEAAAAFIRERAPGKPFFLYMPLSAPHTPWMPLAEFRGKSGAGYYGDFVMQTDAAVGRVLRALDEAKVAGETLVLFTSDNGAHWLPSDIEQFGHRANRDWRGQKADVWEGGHRVPFVVRWPGKVRAGSVSDRLVCLTDLLATFAAAAGVPVPAGGGEDSFSFLPALMGERADGAGRESVVHHSAQGVFAVRSGDWKLVEGLGSGGFSEPRREEPRPGGPEGQLYNLAEDPAERNNLYLRRPAERERLKALLDRLRAAGRSR